MATSLAVPVDDREQLLGASASESSLDSPFDWTYEELHGRATGDYFPLEEDEILLSKGDAVSIMEQTLDGNCFVVLNKSTNETGRVPIDYVDIDVDESNLDKRPKPGVNILRRPGVSKAKGSPFRKQRLSSDDQEKLVASLPSELTKDDQDVPRTAASTFSGAVGPPSDGAAESLDGTKERAQTAKAVINSSPLEAAAGEGRDAAADSLEQAVPPEFKLIERHNIVSVSGADKDGRPVIVFSACRLPPAYQINHQRLLEYLLFTLDKYVEQDYTLVYFHHGFNSTNKPSFSWLRSVYKALERKYKKNLKKLFIVHPTNFIRIMMILFKPFISYKFGKKVAYINRLDELRPVLYLDQIDIPEGVQRYDASLTTNVRNVAHTDSRSVFHTPLSPARLQVQGTSVLPTKQFGVPLEILQERHDNEPIPVVLRTCVEYLEENGLEVLGIFRRTPSNALVHTIKHQFDCGEKIDFADYGDPHLAAVVMKLFLRELPEPLMTSAGYRHVKQFGGVKEEEARVRKCAQVVEGLPPTNYAALKYLLEFLCKVAAREEVNKMSASNLAIVFGPNLVWSDSEVVNLTSLGEINMFVLILINHFNVIFTK